MNIWKSFALLYTNNELSEKEIKKTIPLTLQSKWIKYLGIILTKDWKICAPKTINIDDRYIHTDIQKDITRSWIWGINIVEMFTVPKQSIDSVQTV